VACVAQKFKDFGDARERYGIVAPAGTPADVVAKLNADMVHALNVLGVHKRRQPPAQKPVPGTAAEFGDDIRAQNVLWGKVVKATGAKAN
jgi:tripartite-type tricarboxylate transporter receptor subunit TctC